MKFSLQLALCLFLLSAPTVQASINMYGDVKPATNPFLWTSSTSVYVGDTSTGSLIVSGGSDIYSRFGYLGNGSGSTGTVTITGRGSNWTNLYGIYVGNSGDGTLTITDGGTVSSSFDSIGGGSYSKGVVNVTGSGSKWTTNSITVSFVDEAQLNIADGGLVNVSGQTRVNMNTKNKGTIAFDSGTLTTGGLYASPSDLTGTGTVYTDGLVSDVNLLFDATHSVNQTIKLNSLPEQDVTINLNQNNTADLGAGYWDYGTLTIRDGVTVTSNSGYLGYHMNSTGIGSISGNGSTWTISNNLYLGQSGSAALHITDGGAVSVGDTTYTAGSFNGSYASIYFHNGTLTTFSLFAASRQLLGNGTINTNGLIADDINLVFDATHGLQQTFTLDAQNQNVVVNLDQDRESILGAGYKGDGTLTIRDGLVVESDRGYIGDESGSTGTVTVSGTNSEWNNSNRLFVGDSGDANLSVTDGGVVSNSYGYIGYNSFATGIATVSGAGSKWHNSKDLEVGRYGYGELSITDGGLVSVAETLRIDYDQDGDGFINMSTGGMLALAGEADDSLGEFLALVEKVDAIRWWDDSLNDWALLATATMGTDYTLEYMTNGDLAGYTMLTVGTAPSLAPGDANGDGRVDGSDVTILASNWQVGVAVYDPTVCWAKGDFNGDGRVDGSDVTILAGNWQYGVTGAAAAVPEPGGVALILTALLAAGAVSAIAKRNSLGRKN